MLRQDGLSVVLGIVVGADGLDVANRLWLCPQTHFSISNTCFICLVCLLACIWGLFLVCIYSARGVGVTLFGWVCCWPEYGVWFWIVSLLHGVLAGFDFPVDTWWFCFRLMPLSYVYRGGAVRLLFSLVASALYYSCLFVGHCPFGNKFLIIQKKKRVYVWFVWMVMG